MRLEKISLAVLLIVLVVLLAVPFWRGLALSQLRQTVPGARHSVWDNSTRAYVPNPRPKTDAQLITEHPKDFRLRVALSQDAALRAISDPKKTKAAADAAYGLVRDFPNQPAAYVLLLGLDEYTSLDIPGRPESNGILPEDTPKDWHNPDPPTRERLENCRRMISVLDKAVAADPGNGWFHLLKAEYLYGLHRDAEAVAEVHAAAIAPRITDYADVRGDAWNHLCDLRGDFDPDRRALSPGVVFERFAQVRNTARITANLAYQQISKGNTDAGVRMALDVTGAGYNMCRHSNTFIQAIVGKAMIAIGAKALDPRYEPKTDDQKKLPALQLAHYSAFLEEHGQQSQATLLASQWQQTEKMMKPVHRYLDHVPNLQAALDYLQVFGIATGALAVLLISLLLWLLAALLTRQGRGREVWDRRAAVTSAFLFSLVFAPAIVSLCTSGSTTDLLAALVTMDFPEAKALTPLPLLIPAVVALVAFAVGLAMMLTRPPKEGKNRCMPVWSLLVLYASALGSLGYVAYGITDFSESSEFFTAIDPLTTALTILIPSVGLLLYALVRAQARSSHLVTFVATIRYGAALAAGLSAVIYLSLVVCTATLGVRADSFARNSFKNEAAIVQKALK